jgi:hypothetical protein
MARIWSQSAGTVKAHLIRNSRWFIPEIVQKEPPGRIRRVLEGRGITPSPAMLPHRPKSSRPPLQNSARGKKRLPVRHPMLFPDKKEALRMIPESLLK